jgi:hypothetical protein
MKKKIIIKFRAERYFSDEIVYGIPIKDKESESVYLIDYVKYNNDKNFIYNGKYDDPLVTCGYRVLPNSIEQFTGEYDINGEEVYKKVKIL